MKIGLIGTGTIVEAFIKACKTVGGIEIKSLYTRDKESERAKYFKEKYEIPDIYDDLDEMLKSDINFVYIASPNSLHFKQSMKSLKAGKNVILEKPFTSTKEEAVELLNLANKNKLMIFEAIVNIHMPNYKIVKENLYRLGDIKIVQLNYSQYSSKYDAFLKGENPNVFNPKFSGGALQDINIYNVHFCARLFGIPENAKYYPNIKNGIDTSGIMIMEYPDFIASLVGAKDTGGENFVYIQGEKGYIYVEDGANTCKGVTINITGEEPVKMNNQYEKNRLYYEVLEFKDIFENKDFDRANELGNYSIEVVNIVEKARKEAGIIFDADI